MASSEEARLIVGATVCLGHSLNLTLIAEGIETEDVVKQLVAAGCEAGQGYLFSRPIPAQGLEAWTRH